MPLFYVDKKRGNDVQQMLTCFQKMRENIYLIYVVFSTKSSLSSSNTSGRSDKEWMLQRKGFLTEFQSALQPQYQKKCVQLALHICKFCIHRFNQPKIERKFSILESSKKQNLNLSHTSNSSHSFYIVLDTVTKLEMIKKMTYRRMCIYYMQILCHFI